MIFRKVINLLGDWQLREEKFCLVGRAEEIGVIRVIRKIGVIGKVATLSLLLLSLLSPLITLKALKALKALNAPSPRVLEKNFEF